MNHNVKELMKQIHVDVSGKWSDTEDVNTFAEALVKDMLRVAAAHALSGGTAGEVFSNLTRLYDK